MKHIVFHPPKEEQKIIEIRASQLNSFLNPSPYEFTSLDNKVETMNLGDRYHSIAQYTMLMWQEKGVEIAMRHMEELERLAPFVRIKEYEWFMNWWMEQLIEYASEYKCNYIEEKRQCIIDFSGYVVNLSWTSDADCDNIEYNGGQYGVMIDIKSAWSKWKEEKAAEERQKYYYTYLKCVNEWLDWCKFSYHIYTKQRRVQHQVFDFYITKEEAEKVTKTDLKYYLMSLGE